MLLQENTACSAAKAGTLRSFMTPIAFHILSAAGSPSFFRALLLSTCSGAQEIIQLFARWSKQRRRLPDVAVKLAVPVPASDSFFAQRDETGTCLRTEETNRSHNDMVITSRRTLKGAQRQNMFDRNVNTFKQHIARNRDEEVTSWSHLRPPPDTINASTQETGGSGMSAPTDTVALQKGKRPISRGYECNRCLSYKANPEIRK